MPTESDIIEAILKRKEEGNLCPDDSLLGGDTTPLSLEKMAEAENRLGFQLPSMLRRIYTEIANGGFGHSYGFLGLLGGPVNEDGEDAVSLYLANRGLDPDDKYWSWPEGLLPIAHLGCAMYHCIQCDEPDAPIIWFEPNPHEPGTTWENSFIPFCPSLGEYLLAWINGEDLWSDFLGEA